jgi:PAS domain S-box-containing protein
MKDQSKTKQVLIQELVSLRHGISELERSELDRKRAEKALRESEERLADSNQLLAGVLEHTNMKAVFLDPRFNFIWVNRAYADTCRHDPSFFPGKNHFDLYPQEENQVIFQRVVDSGEPFFVSANPFEFPDQPERGVTWWDWSMIPVKDDTGKVTGLVFTLAEVTGRIRAEEMLRRSEENFRHSLDDSPMGVRIVTKEGETIYANRAVLDIYGYDSMEDLKTTPVEKRYTPESQADFLIRREKRQQGVDVPSEYTINIIRKDGETRHLQVLRKEIL